METAVLMACVNMFQVVFFNLIFFCFCLFLDLFFHLLLQAKVDGNRSQNNFVLLFFWQETITEIAHDFCLHSHLMM